LIRVAIVDDERAAAKCLEKCLHRYEKEAETKFEISYYSSGDKFLSQYYAGAFQIIFMDVSMPGTDGFKTSHRLREVDNDVVLVFVTNLAQFAIKGYEVGALDYILKPVAYSSFKLKIKRALIAVRSEASLQFTVTNEEGLWSIRASDLCYIEVVDHSLIYHTKEADIKTAGSLKNEEKRLAGEPFFRCNYCYLVNLRWVTGVQGSTVTVNGTELQISRNRKKEFMQRLTSFYMQGGR